MKGSKGGKSARAHKAHPHNGKPITSKVKGAPKPGNAKENPAR